MMVKFKPVALVLEWPLWREAVLQKDSSCASTRRTGDGGSGKNQPACRERVLPLNKITPSNMHTHRTGTELLMNNISEKNIERKVQQEGKTLVYKRRGRQHHKPELGRTMPPLIKQALACPTFQSLQGFQR